MFKPIEDNVKFGKDVRIINKAQVNLFGCEIGDNTVIGPFVEITRDVKIGEHCTIESHSFICSGVTIKDNVFIGHGVTFTNDAYPRSEVQAVHPKTTIGRNSSIGSNATILGGISIGRYSIVGAGSVVTKSVPDFAIVAGNPAKVLKVFKSLEELNSYIQSKTTDGK